MGSLCIRVCINLRDRRRCRRRAVPLEVSSKTSRRERIFFMHRSGRSLDSMNRPFVFDEVQIQLRSRSAGEISETKQQNSIAEFWGRPAS